MFSMNQWSSIGAYGGLQELGQTSGDGPREGCVGAASGTQPGGSHQVPTNLEIETILGGHDPLCILALVPESQEQLGLAEDTR